MSPACLQRSSSLCRRSVLQPLSAACQWPARGLPAASQTVCKPPASRRRVRRRWRRSLQGASRSGAAGSGSSTRCTPHNGRPYVAESLLPIVRSIAVLPKSTCTRHTAYGIQHKVESSSHVGGACSWACSLGTLLSCWGLLCCVRSPRIHGGRRASHWQFEVAAGVGRCLPCGRLLGGHKAWLLLVSSDDVTAPGSM